MRGPRALPFAASGAIAALILASCGGDGPPHRAPLPGHPPAPRPVDVWASVPLRGPQAAQGRAFVSGIELAWSLSRHRAGAFRVRLRVLDAARPPIPAPRASRGPGPDRRPVPVPTPAAPAAAGAAGAIADAGAIGMGGHTGGYAADAVTAATDPDAVLYIGELTGVASEVSLPILNAAGIAQLSPATDALGLTDRIPGVTAPDQPRAYAPGGKPTFFRLLPSDAVQAAGILLDLKQAGCARVAVAHDATTSGTTMAALLDAQRALYGVGIVSSLEVIPGTPRFRTYAERLRLAGVQCVVLAAVPSPGTAALTRQIHAQLPTVPILGPARLCSPRWTSAAAGGVPAAVGPLLACTRPLLPVLRYPGGRGFAAPYRMVHPGAAPAPLAIVGFEAMRLALDTIARLGPRVDLRAGIVRSLRALRRRRSVLGTYGFDPSGDTTLRTIGLYRVSPVSHDPVFNRVLAPPRAL